MAQAYHNLGKCFAAKENWTQALDAYEKSLEISQDQGNLMQSAINYVNKAAVYLELSDMTLTATYCARAVDVFREVDYPLGVAEAYKVLGQMFTRKQEWVTAQGLLEESLRICEEYDNPLGVAETCRSLGLLHQTRSETDSARTSLEQARDQFQSLGALHDVETTSELIAAL
jgi:tetratricopeptide (TPR) repeat protein